MTTSTTTTTEIENFIISQKNNASFASVTLKSVCKLLKRGNPLVNEKVTYIAKYSILVNISYENRVNNQREREHKTANFISESLWGGIGEYYHNSPNGRLARHIGNGQKYFVYSPLKSLSFQYFVNGLPATEEQITLIKEFTPKVTESEKQDVQNVIQWRLVKLENILSLSIGGNTFNW